MPFNYPWTCEEIDSNITIILDKIRDHLVDEYKKHYQLEVYELTPDMQSEIEIEAQVIYCNIKEHIEAIRLTNSSIRTAAEDQVARLVEALENLKEETDKQRISLAMRIEELEDALVTQERIYNNLSRECDNMQKEYENTITELEFIIKRDGYGKEK